MSRTTIIKTGDYEVTLTAVDPSDGENIRWVFWVPRSGGYIREGATHSASDQQVCAGLSDRGPTLDARDGDDLLRVIRREWKTYRREAKNARAF